MDFATFFQENQKREKADKITRYHHLNRYVKKGQIVFAGSSLMEQFPIYEFLLDDQLPLTIYNRGHRRFYYLRTVAGPGCLYLRAGALSSVPEHRDE